MSKKTQCQLGLKLIFNRFRMLLELFRKNFKTNKQTNKQTNWKIQSEYVGYPPNLVRIFYINRNCKSFGIISEVFTKFEKFQ